MTQPFSKRHVHVSWHKVGTGLQMSTRVLFMVVQMQKHLDPNPPADTKWFAGCVNEEIVLSGKEEKNQDHTQGHAQAAREPCWNHLSRRRHTVCSHLNEIWGGAELLWMQGTRVGWLLKSDLWELKGESNQMRGKKFPGVIEIVISIWNRYLYFLIRVIDEWV